MRISLWLTTALAGLSFSAAALEVPSDGTPVTLTLDGADSGFITIPDEDIWIDVPQSGQQMIISLEGEAGDVDLLLRFGGPFELMDLLDEADYRSVGSDEVEHITVTRASNPALQAGRWYILPVNANMAPTELTLTATVSDSTEFDPLELQVLYDSQEEADQIGFFDPAPYSSPHNPATTLGEARRLAFERALSIAEEELSNAGATSPVPILVGAKFEDVGGFEDDLITLANAQPTSFAPPGITPGLHEPETIYPGPLAAKQAGTDMCRLFTDLDCGEPDIEATFNSNEEVEWSYALESVAGSGDFISTAMHEVMHGLGFISLFALEDDEDGEFEAGEWLGEVPDIYSRNLGYDNGNGPAPLANLDDAGRVMAAVSVHGLRWTGEAVAQSGHNPFADLNQLFKMYAPAEIRPGSSVSHVDSSQPVPASELMRPVSLGLAPRNLGNTPEFMLDLGWGRQAFGTAGHPIHFGMTGLWYNPETSGQGFLFDIAATQDPPQAAVFWFTFADTVGGPEAQRWYTAQGDYSEGDSSVAMTVYMSTGGAFDRRPPAPENTPVGDMTLVFESCTEGTLSYDFELDNDPGKRVQGSMPVRRISPDVHCESGMQPGDFPVVSPPAPLVLNPGLTGSWYEPATSGQGLQFEVVADQDPPQLVALWFTYAEAAGGAQGQRWFIAQGDYTPGADRVTLDVRMSLGGEFDRRPPVPDLVTVGTAEVEFESCTEAEFEYDINLDNVPGEGTEGRIALTRLTPDILCHKTYR